MKISPTTISLLKNFATINQSLLIKAGNTLTTQNGGPSILARATIAETFTTEVSLYNLHEFLATLTLMGDCEVDFTKQYAEFSVGKRSTKYYYANADLLTPPSDKTPSGGEFFTCDLTERDITMALKAAAVFSAGILSIVGDGSTATLYVGTPKSDTQNSPSNSYQCELGPTTREFDFRLGVENIKIIPDSYTLTLSEKPFAHFKSNGVGVEYWVGAEPNTKV